MTSVNSKPKASKFRSKSASLIRDTFGNYTKTMSGSPPKSDEREILIKSQNSKQNLDKRTNDREKYLKEVLMYTRSNSYIPKKLTNYQSYLTKTPENSQKSNNRTEPVSLNGQSGNKYIKIQQDSKRINEKNINSKQYRESTKIIPQKNKILRSKSASLFRDTTGNYRKTIPGSPPKSSETEYINILQNSKRNSYMKTNYNEEYKKDVSPSPEGFKTPKDQIDLKINQTRTQGINIQKSKYKPSESKKQNIATDPTSGIWSYEKQKKYSELLILKLIKLKFFSPSFKKKDKNRRNKEVRRIHEEAYKEINNKQN